MGQCLERGSRRGAEFHQGASSSPPARPPCRVVVSTKGARGDTTPPPPRQEGSPAVASPPRSSPACARNHSCWWRVPAFNRAGRPPRRNCGFLPLARICPPRWARTQLWPGGQSLRQPSTRLGGSQGREGGVPKSRACVPVLGGGRQPLLGSVLEPNLPEGEKKWVRGLWHRPSSWAARTELGFTPQGLPVLSPASPRATFPFLLRCRPCARPAQTAASGSQLGEDTGLCPPGWEKMWEPTFEGGGDCWQLCPADSTARIVPSLPPTPAKTRDLGRLSVLRKELGRKSLPFPRTRQEVTEAETKGRRASTSSFRPPRQLPRQAEPEGCTQTQPARAL